MKKSKCCICGELCSGKMNIEARKGKLYIFCTFHFNYYMRDTMKEIRNKIKLNKYVVTK